MGGEAKNSPHIINSNEISDYTVIIHIDTMFNMAARSTLHVESIVRGYHVYKTEWTPEIGQEFCVEIERRKTF